MPRNSHSTLPGRPARVGGRSALKLVAAFVVHLASSPLAMSDQKAPSGTTFHRDLAWQIALDRIGFSPGVIDGKIGPKTQLATREFQRVRGLPMTGALDAHTETALGIDVPGGITTYTLTEADFGEIGPAPKDWVERSKLKRLGFESVDAAVAEKFRCSRALLASLNPNMLTSKLKAGDVIRVPNTATTPVDARASLIQIDLTRKVIRVLDKDKRLIALFHCSIAEKKEKRPKGVATVTTITHNPDYLFDPKMWPEVKNVNRKLVIPPGPRNPVGRCWIGLSLPGYGIHGTPNPELIGKTGSHGCFRLTNWDAVRLGRMVAVGMPVRFVHDEEERMALAAR